MRRFALIFISTVFPLSLLTFTTQSALAQEPDAEEAPANAPPPPPPGAPPGAVLVPVGPQEEPHPFSLMFNPLGLFVGRYSITAEYQPVLHHAITLNPFYNYTHITDTVSNFDYGTLSGGGAELGYRFYTGRKGPNGFFVGPSFLFASYKASRPGYPDDSFSSIGGAIDFGGQGVVGPGVIIGGGFGIQYTKPSHELQDFNNLNLASILIAEGGTRPRFLLSVGYAF